MEVNRDKLQDIGFDYGTGTTGAEGGAVQFNDFGTNFQSGGRILGSKITPASFGPKVGTAMFGTEPFNSGLEMVLKRLNGRQYEIIIHALEENVHANMLSAPRIVTLDNQEASILVGYHTPILKSDIAADTTSGTSKLTQTLDYYQEIGIRLNVVPQISDEGYINMIIHPSVTSTSSSVTATNVAGTSPNEIETSVNYPVIDVREAQTQILMKNKETIVLGGLLKDVKSKQTIGTPFLRKIPFLGKLFERETVDNEKIDLLIFITARIVDDDEMTTRELALLNETLAQEKSAVTQQLPADKKDKKKKK
jgi:general secretion pathway protein D